MYVSYFIWQYSSGPADCRKPSLWECWAQCSPSVLGMLDVISLKNACCSSLDWWQHQARAPHRKAAMRMFSTWVSGTVAGTITPAASTRHDARDQHPQSTPLRPFHRPHVVTWSQTPSKPHSCIHSTPGASFSRSKQSLVQCSSLVLCRKPLSRFTLTTSLKRDDH